MIFMNIQFLKFTIGNYTTFVAFYTGCKEFLLSEEEQSFVN